MLAQLIGKTRTAAPQLYRDALPLFHVDPKTWPLLIVHRTADNLVPVDQLDRFYAALKKAGVDATLIRFDGEGHGILKTENQARCLLTIAQFLVGLAPLDPPYNLTHPTT
jgi:dipeptidyl aminopeptidase/acylaminoacyl peptidase